MRPAKDTDNCYCGSDSSSWTALKWLSHVTATEFKFAPCYQESCFLCINHCQAMNPCIIYVFVFFFIYYAKWQYYRLPVSSFFAINQAKKRCFSCFYCSVKSFYSTLIDLIIVFILLCAQDAMCFVNVNQYSLRS